MTPDGAHEFYSRPENQVPQGPPRHRASFTSDDRFVPIEEAAPPATASALLARLRIEDLPTTEQQQRIASWLADNEAPPRLLRSLRFENLIE